MKYENELNYISYLLNDYENLHYIELDEEWEEIMRMPDSLECREYIFKHLRD